MLEADFSLPYAISQMEDWMEHLLRCSKPVTPSVSLRRSGAAAGDARCVVLETFEIGVVLADEGRGHQFLLLQVVGAPLDPSSKTCGDD